MDKDVCDNYLEKALFLTAYTGVGFDITVQKHSTNATKMT
jgi:hypothetical protein